MKAKFLQVVQSRQAKMTAGVVAGMAVVGVASADTAAAITSAFTMANTNMTTVITGVIALAAIVTGVGLIWKFLTK